MSLADIVPVVLATRKERRPALTATERQLRWQAKNRAAWNAYRREWRKRRKEAA